MIPNARLTSRRFALLAVAGLLTAACGRGSEYARSDTASAAGTLAGGTEAAAMVRGTIASVSPTEVVVKSDTGDVTIKLAQPLQVYDREPASLDDVRDNVFVGVTTVKQPDGSEQATEIHIFPDELRGLGEGSHMMMQGAGGGSRMTNGAVSGHRMTNGTVSPSPSRMSNGNVTGSNGSSFVVQYAGGMQKVMVPSTTPVTEIKPSSKTLSAGDQVVVLATKAADGSLSTTKVLLAGK